MEKQILILKLVKGSFNMGSDNKKKSTRNGKKEDQKFHSKNIKHDPQAESARAEYGLNSVNKEQDK
jgi:hypothetical protein